MKAILIVLLALLLQAQAQGWSAYTDIRTGRVEMIAAGSSFTNATIPISFNITYTPAPLSAASSAGIGIVGYNTLQTWDFALNASINTFTATYIHLTARSLQTTVITYLAVHYISVGAQNYFVEVKYTCFLPTVISAGQGVRSQTLNAVSTFDYPTLTCNNYLSGFRIHNSDGLLNYLSLTVSCPSSAVTHTFTTDENNTVSEICFTSVVFCEVCTNITYYEWGRVDSNTLSNSATPATVTLLNRYEAANRMFWGMATLNVSRGSARDFNLQTNYFSLGGGSTLSNNYSSNSGTFAIVMNRFSIATRSCNTSNNEWFEILTHTVSCVNDNNCDNSTVQTLGSSARYCKACHYTCLTCTLGALAENCTSCENTYYRTLNNGSKTCPCDPGYIDIGISLCYTCQYYIAGCYTCSSVTVCTACLTGYTLNASNLCDCTAGYLITGYCTLVKGCIGTTNLGGIVTCTGCNSTLNYVLSGGNCICTAAHYYDSAFNCVGKCGDSLLATDQTCDDGNVDSGDGCSSTCQVQTYYFCNNAIMPSTCELNTNVTGTVRWVQRQLDSNTVEFGIELSPFFSSYYSMVWTNNIVTSMPCSTKNSTYFTHNYLVFRCPYTRTVEGESFSLSSQLDQRYFTSSSYLTVTLPASGMNAKLTLDSNTPLYQFNRPLVYVVVGSALLIALLSVLSERMIGVELVQSVQLVLFGMVVMKVSPSAIAPLQTLIYSCGFNGIKSDPNDRVYPISFSIGQVGLQHEFLMNYNLMYLLQGIALLVCLILKAVLLKLESYREELAQSPTHFNIDRLHPSYHKIKRAYKFMFQRVFFLLTFTSMFLVLFGIACEFVQPEPLYYIFNKDVNMFLALVAGLILLVFLAAVVFNGVFPRLGILPMFMDRKYPVYYSIFNLVLILVLIAFYNSTATPYVFGGLVLFNFLVLLIWRPYPGKLHNITILIEQATVLLSMGVYTFQSYTDTQDNRQTIFTLAFYVIVGLLLLIVVLSAIRLYKFHQYMRENGLSYDDEGLEREKEEEMELMERRKGEETERKMRKKGRAGNSHVSAVSQVSPYEEQYYDSINKNKDKNPLNSASNVYGNGGDTKRDYGRRRDRSGGSGNNGNGNNGNGNDNDRTSPDLINVNGEPMDDYQTFNRNRHRNNRVTPNNSTAPNNNNNNNNPSNNNNNPNNNNNNSNNNNNNPNNNNNNNNNPNNNNSNTLNNPSNNNAGTSNLNNPNSSRLNRSNRPLSRNPGRVIIHQIDPIQPSPEEEDNPHESPYDEFGNVRKSRTPAEEDEADRLRAIKARLRKDFYQKVHGSQLGEPSKVEVSMDNSLGETRRKEEETVGLDLE